MGWYFERFYHLGLVLDLVLKALEERKLHYGAVVSVLQYNRPVLFAGDAEEFLFHCFDASGKFTRSAVAWVSSNVPLFLSLTLSFQMLWKVRVLRYRQALN